jgi:HEPN domain-containing protein
MSDREHACMMLALAQRDFRALRGMLDANIFVTEIFGFHAQQVVEKALKSWLSLLRCTPLSRQGGLFTWLDRVFLLSV